MKNIKHRTTLKRLVTGTLATASLLLILPGAAEAVPISGDLNLSGRVKVDTTTIDWLPLTPATDNEIIVLDATEYMSVLSTLSQGDAIDLNSAVHPLGVPFFLPDFLTFEDDPGLSLNLTFVAPCNPADCLFPGTPFNAYQQVVGGVVRTTVEMALKGTATDSTPNSGPITVESNWIGTWSSDFIGQTIADLQAAFLPGGPGFIISPYSADLTITFIPEPMTLLTFGTGTALLALHRRRRARRNMLA